MSAEPPKRGELKMKLKCKLICNITRGNYEVDIWASTHGHGRSKLQGWLRGRYCRVSAQNRGPVCVAFLISINREWSKNNTTSDRKGLVFKSFLHERKNFFTKMYGKGRWKRWYGVERVRWEYYERVQGCMLICGVMGGGGLKEGESCWRKGEGSRRLSGDWVKSFTWYFILLTEFDWFLQVLLLWIINYEIILSTRVFYSIIINICSKAQIPSQLVL